MKQFYVVSINDDEFSVSWSPSTLNVGCMYFVTYIPMDITGQRVQGSADLKKVMKLESNSMLGGHWGYLIPQYHLKNWQILEYRVKNRRSTDTAFIFRHD